MKNKKIYIGIIAGLTVVGIIIASIFYIKNNKDAEISKFIKNITNSTTKEAMNETEKILEENTNENNIEKEPEKNQQEEQQQVQQEGMKEENKNEEVLAKTESAVVSNVKNTEETVKKEIEVTPLQKNMYVNCNSLNIRSGPDTGYSTIGAVTKATELKITGQAGSWYRINHNGKVGYVLGSYLSSTKPKVEEKVETSSVTVTNVTRESGTVVSNLIIINTRKNTLRYYTNGSLCRSYSCATGASGTSTPQGKFQIFEKLKNRPYYKLNIPGGAPNNPLGPRWMQFKSGGYAIHGTNTESSIGNNVSHGCVRMHNADVLELYDLVPIGTTVIVKSTSQSDKDIAGGYGIFIE